jgi:hypothetical protein
MSDVQKSIRLAHEVAKDAFIDALEILQLIEVMRRQNTNEINKNLSDAGAGGAALVVRNSFIARITTLVARCYARTSRADDKHLRRAFELLENAEVRAEIEKSGSKSDLVEAERLWKNLTDGDILARVKHFRDKLTAHWAKPNPDIPIPSYTEFFDFAISTTQVMERLAHAVGGTGDTLDEMRAEYVLAAQTFWKPWEAAAPSVKSEGPGAFRVVRHTYNDQGLLAERALLSGLYQSRDEAALAAKSEAAKNPPSGLDEKSGQWRITDKDGRIHFLLIEDLGAVAG